MPRAGGPVLGDAAGPAGPVAHLSRADLPLQEAHEMAFADPFSWDAHSLGATPEHARGEVRRLGSTDPDNGLLQVI